MNPALAAAVDALEAERLAPVPRASHAVCVDAEDLALVLAHARAAGRGRGRGGIPGDIAAACQRLDQAIRRHAISHNGQARP